MSPDKLATFKEAVQALVTEAERKMAPNSPMNFTGEIIKPTLEHNVRKFFLDQLLTALGWKLDTNVAEEVRVKGGDTTLFLDYLGVHLDMGIPLLIFEAKAWEKPFVASSTPTGRNQPPNELIAGALNHIKAGEDGTSPVIVEWHNWLLKLRDYVVNLNKQSNNVVKRVVISSGQWLVIFTEPGAAFIDPMDVDPMTILVFTITHYIYDSDHIFRQISYNQLVVDIPSPIRPTQLMAFISANAVRRVFRALWISWKVAGSEGMLDTYPQLLVYPAAIIERSDGVLLHVAESRFGRLTVPPSDVTAMDAHIDEVRRGSQDLLQAIYNELQKQFDVSDLAAFPGFSYAPQRGSKFGLAPEMEQPLVQFIWQWPNRAGEFLLVTGVSSHFLFNHPTVTSCAGHTWIKCASLGLPVGNAPVFSSSADPKSFYISGTNHHCAHRTIHDRRLGKCYVAAFESFLCCKTCIFQYTCWSEDAEPALPCGLSVEQTSEKKIASP